MIPGGASNGRYLERTSRPTFVRDNDDKLVTNDSLGELPGQVHQPQSRHFGNEYGMNSPGDIGDQGSAFAGMYETDSNYRWRKVRGNLDLFVMERNERHLTSLQWKWQKMSKSRRRTPVYESPDSNYGQFWPGRTRYAPNTYPPRDPGYPNYGYSPEYGSPSNYSPPYTHHHDYPHQHYNQPSINEGKMSHSYDYNRQGHVDPWMKKSGTNQHYPHKNFYEEEMKLEEMKRINEDTTNRLLKEQREMESDLLELKKLLTVEMQHQEDGNCLSDRFNDKIDYIEQQIAELDSKLADTATKLQESETERKELSKRVESGRNLPSKAPLFILSDPHNGPTAALTQGSYHDDSQDSSAPQTQSMVRYYDQSHYGGSQQTGQYAMQPDPLDATKKQQEQLKADLENQMANLKEELERQLKEQQPLATTETENVIDARVTNLEKQIEEMNKKIQGAEMVIKNAEIEEQHQQEMALKAKEAHSSAKENAQTNDDKKHIRDEVKHLIHNLSLSPKVSPAQSRRFASEESYEGKRSTDEIEMETLQVKGTKEGKSKEAKKSDPKFKKQSSKISTVSDLKSKTTSASKSISSITTSDVSSQGGAKTTRFSGKSKGNWNEREVTATTIGSEFSQVDEISQSQTQSRNSKHFDWASMSHASSSRKAGKGWDLDKSASKQSLLYGLGTDWCVCPKQVWKHLGDEDDEEAVTRRKCISVIMGSILAFLLLAVVIGLIIGLAANMQTPTESPIRFVVIPGENPGDGT